jgi:hypothetical protein
MFKTDDQRTSYHCAQLITETIQRLQPFSQELQALLSSDADQESPRKEPQQYEEESGQKRAVEQSEREQHEPIS